LRAALGWKDGHWVEVVREVVSEQSPCVKGASQGRGGVAGLERSWYGEGRRWRGPPDAVEEASAATTCAAGRSSGEEGGSPAASRGWGRGIGWKEQTGTHVTSGWWAVSVKTSIPQPVESSL
jgi:hypothetical protein